MEDEMIIVLVIGVFTFFLGLFVGCISTADITELENKCIVYENNVYCKEVTE